jgi:tRNA wybutosine-synthesizing protein 1
LNGYKAIWFYLVKQEFCISAIKTNFMIHLPYFSAYSPLVNLLQSKLVQSNERKIPIIIFYTTETKTTEQFCMQLADTLCQLNTCNYSNRFCITIRNAALYDFQGQSQKTYHSHLPRFETLANYEIVILCISTWINGAIPMSAQNFYNFFHHKDFPGHSRYHALRRVKGFCVLCFGNSDYDQFCTCGIQIYQKLKQLNVHFLLPLIKINEVNDTKAQKNLWIQKLLKALDIFLRHEKQAQEHVNKKNENDLFNPVSPITPQKTKRTMDNVTSILEDTLVDKKDITDVVDEDTETTQSVSSNEDEEDFLNDIGACESTKTDVEDISLPSVHHEMLSVHQRNQLIKEGYKIVGTHSAVKLCRWTKSQLRGRGGCYKHTFYGIESYSCMEATPSLACANKCVFCWRHHKNPVGTTWKWDMDDPNLILDGFIKEHKQMVKQLKGTI